MTTPPATAQSIVLDDNQIPDQVEQLGFSTSYHVEGQISGRPNWVAWSIRQTDSEPPQTTGTASNNVFLFDIPGTFEITAKITYGSVSRPGDVAPPAQTVTKTVTIQPPALKNIIYSRPSAPYSMLAGPNDPQTSPNKIGDSEGQTVYFVFQSNGKTIGPYHGLKFQERLSNLMLTHVLVEKPNGPWRPGNPAATEARDKGSDVSFQMIRMNDGSNDLAIADFKTAYYFDPNYTTTKGDWSGDGPVPDGSPPVAEYNQELRALWTDRSRTPRTLFINNKHWWFNGLGNGTWDDNFGPDLPKDDRE